MFLFCFFRSLFVLRFFSCRGISRCLKLRIGINNIEEGVLTCRGKLFAADGGASRRGCTYNFMHIRGRMAIDPGVGGGASSVTCAPVQCTPRCIASYPLLELHALFARAFASCRTNRTHGLGGILLPRLLTGNDPARGSSRVGS